MFSGLRPFAATSLLVLAGHASGQQVVHFSDFQSGLGAEWSAAADEGYGVQTTPAPSDGSRRFLGYFGGDDVVTLALSSIPDATVSLTLEFDAYLMWSWDGNDRRDVNGVARGPDVFGFRYVEQGATVAEQSWTFSLGSEAEGPQTFCGGQAAPCKPTTGASERYTLGYRFELLPTEEDLDTTAHAPMDSVYRFAWSVPAAATAGRFEFFSRGLQVRNDLDFIHLDEAWGLDNVRVTASIPEPGTMSLAVLGGLSLIVRVRRLTRGRASRAGDSLT